MVLPVQTYTDPRLSQPLRPSPMLQGIQAGSQMVGSLQDYLLKSKIAPLQREYMTGQIAEQPFKQQLLAAQTKQAIAKAKQPFGGQMLPGAAGRAQGLAILRQTYGEDSKDYKNALNDYNTDIKLKMGRTNYFNANTILKNVPELNKMQIFENYQLEQEGRVKSGVASQSFQDWYQKPGQSQQEELGRLGVSPSPAVGAQSAQTGVPATTTTPTPQEQTLVGTQTVRPDMRPERPTVAPGQPQPVQPTQPQPTLGQVQQQAQQPVQQPTPQQPLTQEPFGFEAQQTGLGLVQKTVPTFIQQKVAYATNIEKTFDQMPEQAVTAYSQSPKQLASDYYDSLEGKISKNYGNYLKFMTNARMLATQIRQFYGDSITPGTIKRLESMSNPISWRTSPKAALINYRSLKDTLGREIQTYKKAATTPGWIQHRPSATRGGAVDDPLGIR